VIERGSRPTFLFQVVVYCAALLLFACLLKVSGGASRVVGVATVLVVLGVVWFLMESGILPRVLVAVLTSRLNIRNGSVVRRLLISEEAPRRRDRGDSETP